MNVRTVSTTVIRDVWTLKSPSSARVELDLLWAVIDVLATLTVVVALLKPVEDSLLRDTLTATQQTESCVSGPLKSQTPEAQSSLRSMTLFLE